MKRFFNTLSCVLFLAGAGLLIATISNFELAPYAFTVLLSSVFFTSIPSK